MTEDNNRKEGGGDTASGRYGETFSDLDLYAELTPVVSKTFKILQSLDEFDTFYDFMLENLRQELDSVLPEVADAYNLYHYEEKAEAYRNARSKISRVQSRLLLLQELNILNSNEADDICRDFESCIGRLNGLIRRMEESSSNR